MIFPDVRERVPTPAFSPETVELLKRCAYKPAFVELKAWPELNFSFLRPPGWNVGPPVMSPSLELPIPALASFTRKDPPAVVELLMYEAPFDCLPGDFLDSELGALSLPQRSEGPLGDGWYADRKGARESGWELMAAHRKGKDHFVFLCAMPTAATSSCTDEVNAIVGTFGLRKPRPHPFADRWRVRKDDGLGLSFALPAEASVAQGIGDTQATWATGAGDILLSVRLIPQRRIEDAEEALKIELLRRGIALGPGRVGDLPAAPGGVFAGDVEIRLYESAPSSTRPVEVFLIVGTRRDGGARVRIAGAYPTRVVDKNAWMRARFALVQIAATMRAAD